MHTDKPHLYEFKETIVYLLHDYYCSNQTGTKHWKIIPTDGKYTWGNSPAFDNIEDFIEVSPCVCV